MVVISIDAAETRVEEVGQHGTCPEVMVGVETPGEIHTSVRVHFAAFKTVCTLAHDSFMSIGIVARIRTT